MTLVLHGPSYNPSLPKISPEALATDINNELTTYWLPLTGGTVNGQVIIASSTFPALDVTSGGLRANDLWAPALHAPAGTNLMLSSGGADTKIIVGDPAYGIGGIAEFRFGPTDERGLFVYNTLVTDILHGTMSTLTFTDVIPPMTTHFNTNYIGAYTGPVGGLAPHFWNISTDSADLRNFNGGFVVAQFNHSFGGPGTIGSRTGTRTSISTNGDFTDNISSQQHVVGEFWAQMAHNTGGTSATDGSLARGFAYGMNPQVLLLPGASNWYLANALGEVNVGVVASTQPVTVGGTTTAGNVLTITLTSTVITGSPVSVSFTTGTGQTNGMIANNLVAAVNANMALQGARIAATRTLNRVNIHWQGQDTVTLAVSVSGGATTTLTLGTFVRGASVYGKQMGTMVRLSNDGGDGGAFSCFLGLGSQSSPRSGQMRYGIQVGSTDWSIRPDGTVFGVDLPQVAYGSTARSDPFTPPFCGYGLDFKYVNFSKANGAAYRSPGFVDRGTGVIEVKNTTLTTSAAGASLNVSGQVASAVAIAAGGGGGAGNVQQNYFIGDLIQDGMGGQYEVTSVNPSTGGVTGLTVLMYPGTTGTPPANPITPLGGSGLGLTLTLTWPGAAGKALSLQPSGGALVLANLPTSAAGLIAGQVWRNGTTLNIV